MLRVGIVEDETKWIERIRQNLERYSSEKNVEIETGVFRDGIEIVENYRADLDVLFLDIEMSSMNGMEAAEKIRRKDSEVIIVFITQVARYAVKGYEVGALDFIVKSFSYEIFCMKMDRICRQAESNQVKNVTLNINDDVYKLSSTKILYVEVIKHHLLYHTDEKVLETRGTLKAAEELLTGMGFAKCNSCYLVNLRHVKAILGNDVLIGQERLQISRAKKKEFVQAVADHLGGI
ncbi:MAG: response regulator transcription factor [Blautia sp.]|nr:response regulator transcription factor [Blautia sp.]